MNSRVTKNDATMVKSSRVRMNFFFSSYLKENPCLTEHVLRPVRERVVTATMCMALLHHKDYDAMLVVLELQSYHN